MDTEHISNKDAQINQLKNIINSILNNSKIYIGENFKYKPCIFTTDKETIVTKATKSEKQRIKKTNDLKILRKTRISAWEDHQKIIKNNMKSLKQQGSISTNQGTYVFVANKDFKFTISEIFEPFVSINIVEDTIQAYLMCSPKLNLYKDEQVNFNSTIKIQKGEIIYVGESGNIYDRYQQHKSDKIDRTGAMKFGLRQSLRKNVDFYFIETDKNSELEKHIRDYYGSRFGR